MAPTRGTRYDDGAQSRLESAQRGWVLDRGQVSLLAETIDALRSLGIDVGDAYVVVGGAVASGRTSLELLVGIGSDGMPLARDDAEAASALLRLRVDHDGTSAGAALLIEQPGRAGPVRARESAVRPSRGVADVVRDVLDRLVAQGGVVVPVVGRVSRPDPPPA